MITHRFTTAMHADMIHVLDKGRVVESGTHAELVALGGAYAASWAAQMRGDQAMPESSWLQSASPAFRLMIATSWLAPASWQEHRSEPSAKPFRAGMDWMEYSAWSTVTAPRP